MEMAEENAQIPPKQIKTEEDRISSLPDSIIIEILSRLPSTEIAIRTDILSKRWIHLWKSVTNLIFIPRFYKDEYISPDDDFISFIDKTLTQRNPQVKLNKLHLQLDTSYDIRFESQLRNWIRHAITCNVENLTIALSDLSDVSLPQFVLDESFFVNSCFTNLTLDYCVFNPSGGISWKNLKSLCVSYGKLDNVLIENILSGSPSLETLELEDCYGFTRINITSKSVKNLLFSGNLRFCQVVPCEGIEDNIKINAPNVLSLTIKGNFRMLNITLLNMSSLVEADLNYTVGLCPGKTRWGIVDEWILKRFILDLQRVNEITIGFRCFKVLSQLEAKGFISPANLKVAKRSCHDVYF